MPRSQRPRTLRRALSHALLWIAFAVSVAVLVVAGAAITAGTRPHPDRIDMTAGPAVTRALDAPGRGGPVPSFASAGGLDPDAPSHILSASPAGRWAYAAPPPLSRWTPSFTRAPLPRSVALPPASALGFGWPLHGVISSPFGDEHPLGIDIAPLDPLGLVLAGRDGVVVFAGGDPCCGYGYYVIIDHGDGLMSIYGHLRDRPVFQAGEQVERGTVLGVAGDTGHSIGIHLHFEVRLHGVPVDPELVLTAGRLTPLSRPSREDPADAAAQPEEADADPRLAEALIPEPGAPTALSDDPEPASPPVLQDESPVSPPTTPTPATATSPPPAATVPAPTPSPTQAATATPLPPTATRAPAAPSPVATASALPAATGTVTQPAPTPASAAELRPTPASPTPATPLPSPTPATIDAARPAAEPSPAPPPAPRCAVVRVQPPVEPLDPASFITLEADEALARTLVAERCTVDGPTTITLMAEADLACFAVLQERDGTRLRSLRRESRESPPVGQGKAEFRWTISAQDLRPGLIVRVACGLHGERDIPER